MLENKTKIIEILILAVIEYQNISFTSIIVYHNVSWIKARSPIKLCNQMLSAILPRILNGLEQLSLVMLP